MSIPRPSHTNGINVPASTKKNAITDITHSPAAAAIRPLLPAQPVHVHQGGRSGPKHRHTSAAHRPDQPPIDGHPKYRLAGHVRRVQGEHAAPRRPLNQDGAQRAEQRRHKRQRVEVEVTGVVTDDAQEHAEREAVGGEEGGRPDDAESGAQEVATRRPAAAHQQRELRGGNIDGGIQEVYVV